jgi:thiol-disulfide isomerase/thioredoxin
VLKHALKIIGFLLVPWFTTIPAAQGIQPVSQSLSIGEGSEIPLYRYQAKGNNVLLWLPSESGLLSQEKKLADQLAQAGVEVWLADLFNAYFLPSVASSIDQVPTADVASLISHVKKVSGKHLYLVASGRGALLVLRGAHLWQEQNPDEDPLAGVILISPKLFVRTPEPGLEGEFLPVVTATNLPLFILQPGKSIWRWKLNRIIPALGEGGSDVYARLLPDVRDRFYYRPDAVPAEDAMARQLPSLLKQAIPILETVGAKPRTVVALKPTASAMPSASRTEPTLRPFQGDPQPPALQLEDLAGKRFDLRDYKGKVVLVNFWATWCPPCVHEMPSLQRLEKALTDKPFKILAVNMAEDKGSIQDFLKKMVNVDFTILMDKDGAALGRWKVFAFPTTYIVGKAGRIRYALFGSIDWDNQDVLDKIAGLLNE